MAQDEDDVGSLVVFVDGLEEGNFHVQARSKLFVRAPEVVTVRALAEMTHQESKPAPIGPPSLTAEAWLTSSEAVQVNEEDPTGEGTVVAVRRQTGMELNQRSFSTRQINVLSKGEACQVEDAERDRARDDRRACNVTTAVIEEVEPGQSGMGGVAQHGEGQSSNMQRSTAAQGPMSFSPSMPE